MSVYKKLQQARLKLQSTALKKSGKNKFAGFEYFELGDFLPTIQTIFNEVGLCGTVSFGTDIATLNIVDTDDVTQSIVFTSPMSTAELKGCHAIQNLGAVQTYLRRYLWVAAMEIVEHDALDASAPIIDVSALIDGIKASKDMDELKTAFAKAYSAAQKDKTALNEINQAKEARKAELA